MRQRRGPAGSADRCRSDRRRAVHDARVPAVSAHRPLLIVDPSRSVDPLRAATCVRRHRLTAAFAGSRAEVLARLGVDDTELLVVLPPMRHGDPFALMAAARALRPRLAGAILLGDARLGGTLPRAVWMNRAADDHDLVDAVAALARLRAPIEVIEWCDEETTALSRRYAMAARR
jgi:hypothetical protein